jgi:hypothetical protein
MCGSPQFLSPIHMKLHRLIIALWAAGCFCAAITSPANAQTLRIATYNIDADTGGAVGAMGGPDAGPGLTAVLQAIGQEKLDGHAQPLDVLALEELNYTTSGSTETISQTLSYVTGQLNSIYGAGTYAYDTTIDPSDGNSTGNGPSGLIYNTKTVAEVGAADIIPNHLGSSGEARAPIRYELQPKGGAAYTDFYLYVSHTKASSGSSNAARRNVEAQDIRSDAATLGTNAHIIYTGDYNLTGGSSEAAYQTMVGTSPSTIGQAIDTANPGNNFVENSQSANSVYWPLLSESATDLTARFDLQLVTSPTVILPGLQLVANTLTPFGNNGSVGYGGAVTDSSNTALSDLSNRSTILNDLTTDTDHLPVVADYTIVPPGDMNRDQQVNASDVTAMIAALANIPAYEAAHNLTAAQMLAIGDVNGDGKFNNADVQALISFLSASHGTGSPAPEPASIALLGLAAPGLAWLLRRRQRASQCG